MLSQTTPGAGIASRFICILAIIGAVRTAQGVVNEVLLVTSQNNGNIVQYDAATGAYLGIFIPGGTATLAHPEGMAIGPDGHLYVASGFSANPNAILRFNKATGQPIGTGIFATGFGGAIPRGIAFGPDQNLYVADDGFEVRRFSGATGQFIDAFVSTGLLRAEHPVFHGGSLFVTDRDADRVQRYDAQTGQFLSTFTAGGPLDKPEGLCFGPDGNVYVSSANTHQVLRYSPNGVFLGVFVGAGSGGLNNPENLLFGSDGNLLVADSVSDRVLRYNGTTGAFMSAFQATPDMDGPTYMLVIPEPSTLFLVVSSALFALRGRRPI